MGRVNVKGVIFGGLVAGLVLNVIDFLVWGVWLKADMAAMMQSAGRGPIDNLIPLFVVLDFMYGIVLVYLYAAIRPRFGAGPGTAVHAGVILWLIAALLHAVGEAPMGLMPRRLYLIGTVVGLVEYLVAAVAGAKFYREV
jgi:hypothetical protein